MKALVVYSSRTGNTRKIAEAIAAVLPGCEIHPVESAPAPEGYDLVAVGYWVDKGMPDAQAKAYLETVRDTNVALFGTLGAWPDSDHARDCIAQGEALVNAPERGNKVLGTYLCQGKVDPKIVAMMQKVASDVHPMTPERKARLEEAAKHPDEADCLRAQKPSRVCGYEVACTAQKHQRGFGPETGRGGSAAHTSCSGNAHESCLNLCVHRPGRCCADFCRLRGIVPRVAESSVPAFRLARL